jgi:predicted component of type VI protein secretion system
MTLILQITEIPENESIKSRVVVLPPQGGTIGTAFDCTLQLPDRSQQIAPIQGRFRPSQQGMMLEPAASQLQIMVNNRPLVYGRPTRLEDGAVINIGGYTLLATESGKKNKAPAAHASEQTEKPTESTPHFSAKGVFAEDPFGDDPFDGMNADPFASSSEPASFSEESTASPFTQSDQFFEEDNIPTIEPEPRFVSEDEPEPAQRRSNNEYRQNKSVARLSDSEFIEATRQDDQKFGRLVSMIEESNARASQQQAQLFKALDETLNAFLEEFSPEQLEEKFSDYYPSRFFRNKKHYWDMYQRDFQRRHSKNEYHRLFKAMLLDNLQKQND